jgi:hypothetical protein
MNEGANPYKFSIMRSPEKFAENLQKKVDRSAFG